MNSQKIDKKRVSKIIHSFIQDKDGWIYETKTYFPIRPQILHFYSCNQDAASLKMFVSSSKVYFLVFLSGLYKTLMISILLCRFYLLSEFFNWVFSPCFYSFF